MHNEAIFVVLEGEGEKLHPNVATLAGFIASHTQQIRSKGVAVFAGYEI